MSDSKPVLLDTVVLVDHFNGREEATEYIRSHRDSALVSAITYAEVLSGLDSEDRALARRLLDRFAFVAIDPAIAELAAGLRQDHGLSTADALQGACALHHGLRLATRATDHFSPKRFDWVVEPY